MIERDHRGSGRSASDSLQVPAGAQSRTEWETFRAAKLAFERAPGEATAAAVLDAWEPWFDAFVGPNDPDKPRQRAAVTAGLLALMPTPAKAA